MTVAFDLTAVSGINAANSALGVIANNLANSQTQGFKSSRAEFADIFAGAQNAGGSGVRTSSITQNFTQGTINSTGRELDFAISGQGFFITEDRTGRNDNLYTRNGSFKLDNQGILTSQEGNNVQGFLLNQNLTTPNETVFDTTLSSIDFDALNRVPVATDLITSDINLDGAEANNVNATGVSVSDPATSATPARTNLARLVDFESGAGADKDVYSGAPDFSTNQTIFDSLGGEHRLTTNFFKRDVVSQANSTTDAIGNTVAAGAGVKYSSWIAQYTVQDFNPRTQTFETSGHVADAAGNLLTNANAVVATPAPAGTDRIEGQLLELRFDTTGNLINVNRPANRSNPGTVASGTNAPLPAATWPSTNGNASGELNFVIDSPFGGGTDPLGNAGATPVSINVNLEDMTQFSGNFNLRGVTQNGFSTGELIGVNISSGGVIEARYSNGRALPIAVLALGDFNDRNGAARVGGQSYAETFQSGPAQLSQAESNGFGSLTAGALEFSNVDTANELVTMIQIQRMFQASAQVISTSQTLTQTVLNI